MSSKSQNNAKKATSNSKSDAKSTGKKTKSTDHSKSADKAIKEKSQSAVKETGREETLPVQKQSSSPLFGQEPGINYRARQMAVASLVGGTLLVLTAITGVIDYAAVLV